MALNLPIGTGKFWPDAKAAIETWAAGVDTKLAQSGTSGPGAGGAGMETYTGPTPLALGTAPAGTVRQFYVAAAGTIDDVSVAKDEFHTFGRTSTGWHHYEPSTGVPTPTTSDTTRPSDVPTLTATVNGTNVLLQWGAATDNVAIESYDLTNNGGTTIVNAPVSNSGIYVREHNWTGLAPTTSYTFGVKARDLAGNVSANWKTTTVTTGAASDTAPPSAPGALTTTPDMTAIAVSWTAATDDVGVTKYRISSNGGATWTEIGNVTSHTLTGLTASTSYSIAVQAGDDAGNWGPSATKTVSTTSSPAPGGDDFTGDGITLTAHTHTTVGTPKPWTQAGATANNAPGNWKIANNALVANYAGPGAAQVFDWGGTDGVVTAAMRTPAGTAINNGRMGMVLRYVDANNHIGISFHPAAYAIIQVKGGVTTTLTSGNPALTYDAWHVVAVTLNGTSLSMTIDGGTPITATVDAAINGTRYGPYVPSTSGTTGTTDARFWDYLHVDPLP